MAASLTHQAYKVNQLQQHEADAAQALGMNLFQLMQRAGARVFAQLQRHFPLANNILVVCGKGNNGGDGYIIADLAQQAGMKVTVLVLAEREAIRGDAKQALSLLEHSAVNIDFCPSAQSIIEQLNAFHGDLIVDCIFGIGFNGPLSPALVQLFTKINNQPCAKLSVDVPSGLNADLGTVSAKAIKADLTVTLIAYKQGLLTGQAAHYVGNLQLETLGIHQAFSQLCATHCFRQHGQNIPQLEARPANYHKGHIGMLLAIGGYHAYAGAICLSAEAALRSGASLVSVCCHEKSRTPLLIRRPELMVAATSAQTLGRSSVIEQAKVLIVGPGLAQTAWSQALFKLAMACPQPKVVDADALNLLAAQPQKSANWILTPHPGEAARLLSCAISDIEADRFAAVQKIAQKYGGICVLKGAGTLISDGHTVWINTSGNPGMASGGMGDVLTGIIGALLLQMSDLFTAARLGVYIHGRAADIIAKNTGEIGLLASDLYSEIQRLINGQCY
ncbi:NAD(P)H-hydrate epimerase [Colwellia chukchiensis]|uniref:Bifunctional NAD(P)H-hydrate repair enzyme n=2 Tax=Colwellia chukchiensis TaxID=641665 RepID=A0A1H7TB08_9GAMM|nr:NAD(P)H-hydrate epimerase [Colwellia chukchiensis]